MASIVNQNSQETLEIGKLDCNDTMIKKNSSSNSCGCCAGGVEKFRQFSQETTLHGIRYTTDQTIAVSRRLFWVTLMLATAISLSITLKDSFIRYQSVPVNTVVEYQQRRILQFPAVTFCNYNKYRKSIVADTMVERLLQDMYSFNQTTIYAEGLDWMKYNDSTNEITNITDFGLVAAHKIEDILVQCQWSTHSTCHPENFTTIFADFGVCYTFNGDADNPLFVHNRGRIYGLYMILDLQQHEYFYGSHRGAGIKMLVHSATDPPLIGELGMALGPGMDATVALTTSRVERTNCKDESLDYYKHYSGANCELAKRTNSVLATCGCRAPYMPGDERLCTLEEEVTCLPNVLGKHDYFCPAPCDATIYHATLSFASFPGEHVLQKISETYNKSEDEIWKNFIAVSIYMEDLSVFMTKQEIAYTIDNFLGDMGGQLGLCLGASILTMWEFGEFVLTLLCYRCRGLFKMMKGERKK